MEKTAKNICPICGQDNNCQHGKGKCWCEEVVFPKELLDMASKGRQQKSCICRSCLEKYIRITKG